MKTFREFIVEADVASHPDIAGQTEFQKRVAAEMKRRQAARAAKQGTYVKTGESRTPPSGGGTTQSTSGATQTPTTPRKPGFKIPNIKVPQGVRQAGRLGLAGLNVAAAGSDIVTGTQERKAKGERLRTAIPKAAAEAGGGMAGAQAAATAASRVLPKNPWINIPGSAVAGVAGYYGGKFGTSGIIKRLESPLGPSNKDVEQATQRYGVKKSRQSMSKSNVYGATKGSAISGLGGQLNVDKKARTITSQGRTAKLGSTQLVRDPKTGRQVVGDLAYKGGKPVYIARASTASRDSNASPGGAWRNIQRGLNIGGQRQRDAAASQREYRTALANTQRYTRGLGISTKSATAQRLPGYGTSPKPVPKPTLTPSARGTLTTPTRGARTKSDLVGSKK